MRYASETLSNGETAILRVQTHPVVYLEATILILICTILMIASVSLTAEQGIGVQLIASVFGAAAAIVFVKTVMNRISTEITITTHRIVFKTGMISRKTFEIDLRKLESVTIKQSLLGRILDYGSVVIRGEGRSYQMFESVRNPQALRKSAFRFPTKSES